MPDFLTQLLAFSKKEINEVMRQPRLMLSLLLGPVFILLLFGMGFKNDQPRLAAVLVVPAHPPAGYPVEEIKRAVGMSFDLVEVVSDRELATASLRSGSVDVVEIWPNTLDQLVLSGHKIGVEFYTNETNPIKAGWIQYLAYIQIGEINKALLTDQVTQRQRQLDNLQIVIQDARALTQKLRASTAVGNQNVLLAQIEQEMHALVPEESTPHLPAQQALTQLQDDLDSLRASTRRSQFAQQQESAQRIAEQADNLTQAVSQLRTVPPEVVVSPIDSQYHNLAKSKVDTVIFYAPAVLALLIQHIAITLGALALVRERGSIEFFRIAPVTVLRLVLGKYVGYLVSIATMIAVLTLVIVYALGVPFLGNVWWFALEALVLLLASLGIGFTISAISSTDNQAVQLSMLMLVLSIFFSGFFLSLDSFTSGIRGISYAIPLTHGIIAFQNEMLSDHIRDTTPILWTSVISCMSFATTLFFTIRQFRQVTRAG